MRAGFSLQDIGVAYGNTVICCFLNWTDGKIMVFPFSYVKLIEAKGKRSEVKDGQSGSPHSRRMFCKGEKIIFPLPV